MPDLDQTQPARHRHLHKVVGTWLAWQAELRTPRIRDQRGLSQSTENAVLLSGAIIIAAAVIAIVTAYVNKELTALK